MYEVDDEIVHVSREYFLELVEQAATDCHVADVILYVSTLEGTNLGLALPSLCLLAAKCHTPYLKDCLADICYRVIIDVESTKGCRKAAYSCLKEIYRSDKWSDFYILAECLEEPQFHIVRPVLPRLENILEAVVGGEIHPKWASLILVRAMQHSNGWIRMWGVQNSTDKRLYLGSVRTHRHLFGFLLPSLNSNDIFWRLLENSKLSEFLDSLKEVIEFMVHGKNTYEQVYFFNDLLAAIEELSCPLTFYYMSTVLFSMTVQPLLSLDSITLFRIVISKAEKTQYPVLKNITLFQFCVFLCRITVLSEAFFLELGELSASFSSNLAIVDNFFAELRLIFTKSEVCISLEVAIDLFQSADRNKGNASQLLWIYCDCHDIADTLLANVCLRVVDLVEDARRSDDLNSVLVLLLDIETPDVLNKDVVLAVTGFLLMQAATSQGSLNDIRRLRELYIPFLKKFNSNAFVDVLEAIYPALCRNEQTINTERRAEIAIVLQEMMRMNHSKFSLDLASQYLGTNLISAPIKRSQMLLSKKEFALICSEMLSPNRAPILGPQSPPGFPPAPLPVLSDIKLPQYNSNAFVDVLEAIYPALCRNEQTINTERRAEIAIVLQEMMRMNHSKFSLDLASQYLGTNLISAPIKRSQMLLSKKEFALICSEMQSASLDILIRFLPQLVDNYTFFLNDVLDQLDCASSYMVKERLLQVIEILLDQIHEEEIKLSAINACCAVVNEEKKSQNSIPALSMLFKLGMREDMVKYQSINIKMKELYAEFMEIANLSQSVALVICSAIFDARKYICEDWASQIVCLAIYGPVPKKESRVMSDAYSRIYSNKLGEVVGPSDLEKVHEIVQRTRLLAVEMTLHCCARSQIFSTEIVREIVNESLLLDKNSSRSFGLSLAHRQKTRAMAVLLICSGFVQDRSVLDEVLQHCIYCIADPCQQFSIKLIVEWIIVRMCSRFEEYKRKIYLLGKELASKRIGSISSWINILLHLVRISNDEEDIGKAVSLIVPWTTAQNFGVRCSALAATNLIYRTLMSSSPVLLKKFELLKSIVEFSEEPAGNSQRIIANLLEDFYFCHLHMVKDLSWQTLFITIPLKTGLPDEETIPLNLIKTVRETSVPLVSDNEQMSGGPSVVYSGTSKNATPDMMLNDSVENDEDSVELPDSNNAVQRKIVTKDKKKAEDASLIVVASLIDKPNNLGGLCRTCEIFGVDSMVVADLLLTNDTGFKALSMSSENWQKIEAIRPDMLGPYLEGLRAQGYTVIAAEQTTDSVPMHKFVFPRKSVILMGDEKEGVPTQLLRCVDKTVEIEQLGQTRSLNVHVTAALFISKYAEQVLFS